MRKRYLNVILLALVSVVWLSVESFCLVGQKKMVPNMESADSASLDTTFQLAMLKSKKWVMEGQGDYYFVSLFSDSLRTNYENDFLLGVVSFIFRIRWT